MSLLADALQPLLANGLLTVGGRLPAISLSKSITAPGSAYAISFDVPAKEILLDFRDPPYVRTVVAADISRLATSCFQSISVSASAGEEKLWLPWFLIRIYYAAFYAAHATIRALGVGCSWLEADDLNHIQAVSTATLGTQIPWKEQSGTYKCVADTATGVLRWTRLAAGRPHEALWDLFDSVLADAGAAILSGPLPRADAQTVFGKLEAYRMLSASHGTKAWLSRTRNDIQYKLLHDVWYPTGHDRQGRDRLQRLVARWTDDPMGIDLDGFGAHPHLVQFCGACAFVIGMCRVLVVRIAERNLSESRSFMSYGPLAYAGAARIQL